jgi:hypothetical protein
MAITGVAITKRTAFRDSTQEWNNVYYYESSTTPILGDAQALKNDLVTFEKTIHSTAVSFVYYRIWSAGGNQAQNQMIDQGDLTGVGALGNDPSLDRERAFLFRWPAGTDIRGHPVYLRKWYHTCGWPGSVASSSGIMGNTSGLTTTQRNAFAATINAVRVLTGTTQTFSLVAPSGRETEGDAECHRYLEHHQLGDQWRG